MGKRMSVWFFFSSRRRHTSCGRDWSSDVCSSDLCGFAREPRPLWPVWSTADPQFQATGYHEQPDISSLSYLIVLQRCRDPLVGRLFLADHTARRHDADRTAVTRAAAWAGESLKRWPPGRLFRLMTAAVSANIA